MNERTDQTASEAVAERVLGLAGDAVPGAEVEVAVGRQRLALTRFANSRIHQNIAEDTRAVRLRIHADGRTTTLSSTVTTDDGLRALAQRAADAVRVAPRDPGWPGVAPATPTGPAAAPDPATIAATPADRAQRVRAFVDAAGGLETAGYCRTTHAATAFVNSAGHAISEERAEMAMDAIARSGGADGVARFVSEAMHDVDGAALGARAAAKATAAAQDPIELPPDRYEVVLEPTAVADLLMGLSVYGFNGKAVLEGRSFAELGAAQLDQAITIVDDPLAAGARFDVDGTPHQRLVLTDGGVTAALAYDRRTAAEVGAQSTGHATGMTVWGPFALYLTLQPAPPQGSVGGRGECDDEGVHGPIADSATARLVADVRRGLLVTDFWYTRVLDPKSLAITGLTRNGVWLIEDGEVSRPVANLRFTQAYAEAVAPGAVLGVGTTATALPYSWPDARWTAPSLHLASWNFTGGASG